MSIQTAYKCLYIKKQQGEVTHNNSKISDKITQTRKVEHKAKKTVGNVGRFTAGLIVGGAGTYMLLRIFGSDEERQIIKSDLVKTAKKRLSDALRA